MASNSQQKEEEIPKKEGGEGGVKKVFLRVTVNG